MVKPIHTLMFLWVVPLAACGGSNQTAAVAGCSTVEDAILSITWSFADSSDGGMPNAIACQHIDHVEVSLSTGCGSLTIAPVPCTLDKFRYDHLPEGPATVGVRAIDDFGHPAGMGSAPVDLGRTPPPVPVGVTLK
jgi:hypothetical protein